MIPNSQPIWLQTNSVFINMRRAIKAFSHIHQIPELQTNDTGIEYRPFASWVETLYPKAHL